MECTQLTKDKKPAVGDNIEARCAKCKKVTTHQIIDFKKNETIGKVCCGTCTYEHAYRQPRVKKTQEEKDATILAKKLAKSHAEFEDMIKDVDQSTAVSYNINSSFGLDDIIDHKIFGLGKVVELMTPNKMVVQFRDGMKILVCVLTTGNDPK